MQTVESTDRGGIDSFHFGACFFGFIVVAAGVIALSPTLAVLGIIMTSLGLAYFWAET